MQEILISLLTVVREFCPRLGGESINSAVEGTLLSATDLLRVLVTHHQPMLTFSFLLSLSGGKVHKAASDDVDPPGHGHCMCRCAQQGWWEFFNGVSH